MIFSEKDKEILHSYVDNIVNYIEDNFGSSKTRYIKTLNKENENFDGNK